MITQKTLMPKVLKSQAQSPATHKPELGSVLVFLSLCTSLIK